MCNADIQKNVWLMIIKLLASQERMATSDSIKEGAVNGRIRVFGGVKNVAYAPEPSPHLKVIERASSLTIIISWSDPSFGHYGYQRWRRAVSKRDASCSLTGDPILAGDAIFRPARLTPKPANSGAMVLAKHIDVGDERTSHV